MQGDELIIGESDLWCLILTNAEYPVPEDYTVELQMIPGTEQSVDVRIYEPLMEMLDAMREQGLAPIICSAGRCVFLSISFSYCRTAGNIMQWRKIVFLVYLYIFGLNLQKQGGRIIAVFEKTSQLLLTT